MIVGSIILLTEILDRLKRRKKEEEGDEEEEIGVEGRRGWGGGRRG